MRILTLFDGDYPWDVRVAKSLESLRARGHELVVVARNPRGRPRREATPDAEVWRLPHGGRFEGLLGFPAFFHPVWIRECLRAARGFGAERILVRDLPLAPLGLWVARRLGVPVIVDMAEPYPLALRSNWQFDRLGGLDHLTRSPRLADAVERWVVRRQPRTLVVSEEAADRLVSLGLARERITLVRNTPVLSELPAVAPADRDAALRAAVPQLVFTGILVGDRGVEVAIAGVAELAARHGRKVELVVVGDGRARASYEEAARTLGVAERVRFTGFVPHAELPRHWQDAAVGLLPFHRCPHIDTTLANKLFDYMAMGLPIVASDARPMQRVLAETGAGVTFRAGDARDFARAVEALLADPGAALAMAERGRQAAQVTFRWERDAERLCEAVERP